MDYSTQAKPVTEKVFLIDFENVHEKGLEGIGTLKPEDTVHLFYTKNASKISLDILSEIQAKLQFHKVNVGKQSLDMQLVSYLGFLIGTIGKEPEYIIVSNDAGFHNTLAFWGEKNTKISQMKSMKAEKAEDALHASQPAARSSSIKTASSARSPYRMRAAQAVAQASSPSNISASQNTAVSAQAEHAQVPVSQVQAPSANVSDPIPTTVHVEETVSSRQTEVQNSHPVRGATEKTQMNNKITVALRDRKVESEKIGKATATVMKLYGSKNFRQAAYREMIKLFGQKEGLELYNIIRPLLPAAATAQKKNTSKASSKQTSVPAVQETEVEAASSDAVVNSGN
ncbi:MAG: hypothetical protein J6S50_10440 [Oscillospiraceae bacterium]|nr:hypothetical protein [Oscillospiraceae bacterium]